MWRHVEVCGGVRRCAEVCGGVWRRVEVCALAWVGEVCRMDEEVDEELTVLRVVRVDELLRHSCRRGLLRDVFNSLRQREMVGHVCGEDATNHGFPQFFHHHRLEPLQQANLAKPVEMMQ